MCYVGSCRVGSVAWLAKCAAALRPPAGRSHPDAHRVVATAVGRAGSLRRPGQAAMPPRAEPRHPGRPATRATHAALTSSTWATRYVWTAERLTTSLTTPTCSARVHFLWGHASRPRSALQQAVMILQTFKTKSCLQFLNK